VEHLEENLNDAKFNVITLWHVLEHIPDLENWFSFIHRTLDEKGVVIIAVPNNDSHDAKYFREAWAAYDVPRHLWHFTPKTIIELFQRHGFSNAGITPMVFDSFYVSLLSTKNIYGKPKLISAFWRGFVSNLLALKSGRTYSSQIYFFRKNKI
jgi:SAM-dependent methyltransferase